MTEITPVPESVRKAYCEKFGLYLQPMTASRPPYEYDNWKRQEDILQFIAAYGLECEREGYVKGTDSVWGMIAAQREEAVREVIEELDAQAKRWTEEFKKGPCETEDDEGNKFDWQRHAHHKSIAYITASVHLRDKFLPTSLTPKK